MRKENANFIYAIIRNEKRFRALRDFTLKSAQEDIDKMAEARKDGQQSDAITSNKSSLSEDTRGLLQRPSVEDAAPNNAFSIGDDSDDDSDDDDVGRRSSLVSPTTESHRSSVDEAVPVQLRGLSEKARGKLPAGAFTRTSTSTSLVTNLATLGPASPPNGQNFTPSEHWVYKSAWPIIRKAN